ncbi:MAG TPA: hypothetical protein VH684_10590 [Xanthobacteraceae bacterium]|jgi:hypothetical protein
MPRYFFNLKTRDGTVFDRDGTDLANHSAAKRHAELVARELMANREASTRAWRLDVRDSSDRTCSELLFATIDDSMSHLTPELRSSLDHLCASSAAFAETIHALRLTLLEVRATIARAEGTLHLAAVNGRALR